jgi:hypothetical protein
MDDAAEDTAEGAGAAGDVEADEKVPDVVALAAGAGAASALCAVALSGLGAAGVCAVAFGAVEVGTLVLGSAIAVGAVAVGAGASCAVAARLNPSRPHAAHSPATTLFIYKMTPLARAGSHAAGVLRPARAQGV